ncbi:MAG: prolipoprotein diacylglyceryl transferase family protein [Acutalibacteraceae bacterium]
MPVHPTFLYESVWCLTGFLIIALWLMRRRQYDGQVFLFYTAWYGLGRFFIEGLRTDSLMWGPVRVSQALALCAFVISATALLIWLGRKRSSWAEAFLPLYINTPEGQAVAAGTFYQKAPVTEIAYRAAGRAAGSLSRSSQPLTRGGTRNSESEREREGARKKWHRS